MSTDFGPILQDALAAQAIAQAADQAALAALEAANVSYTQAQGALSAANAKVAAAREGYRKQVG